MKSLFKIISDAQTEEELKHFFAKRFKIKLSTKNFIDLYTPQILFEFKLDSNLQNPQVLAKIVAQTLYYIRRLKFGSDYRPVCQNICIVTKNLAALFPTETFADFFNDKTKYDWDLAPSAPCKILVNDLSASELIINAKIYNLSVYNIEIAFATDINNIFKGKSRNVKQITEQNFEQIFSYWLKLFGADVTNGRKPSEYFITDIEQGKSEDLRNSVLFRMTGGERVEKSIKPEKYHEFWDFYDKICSAKDITAIRQRMDRMTEENLRRRTGEFYTPIQFADKAFEYLTRTVGEWWLDDNFRLWDMAAGTGNLEFNFPQEILKKCYISTLIQDDADYCRSIFPEATVFQYDYLNDDTDKLPENLRGDLENPNIKWIIYINPPYATANNPARKSKLSKNSVSETKIKKLMMGENMADSSRELFAQFLYRINLEFANRQVWLGIFSKLKYINADWEQKLRDKYLLCKFERGFIFNSKAFHGCKGQFPVGFLIWNFGEQISLHEQEIFLDVYDMTLEKVAVKKISSLRPEEALNKWIKRPPCRKKFPPMSSALNINRTNKDRRDRIAENFLASLMSKGNDFAEQNGTALLSAPYVSTCGMSITEKNFEQAMIVHMVRRLPKATWLNDRDQFMQPTKELPREFITDAVIWSLFSASNQTVSLRDVEYEGEVYQIRNNFYPFELAEVKNWECSSPEMRLKIFRATEDRFAALWIKNHELSAQAVDILNSAREIYRKFYAELKNLDARRWKIEAWDAGWYQIRMALGATLNLDALSAKLLPRIYDLGFLRDEVRYF